MKKLLLLLLLIATPVSAQLLPWGACRTSGCVMTGTVWLSDGSTTSTSWGWSSDNDGTPTGMYRSGANQIGMVTNGSLRWILNASGHILPNTTNTFDIGTSSNFIRNVYPARMITGASTPTAASTGIGSTGTVTVHTGSSDMAGMILISPGGAGIAATGTLTVTFNATAAYGTNSPVCTSMLASGAVAWNARATVLGAGIGTTTAAFNWDNNAVALTAGSNQYAIHFICIGK